MSVDTPTAATRDLKQWVVSWQLKKGGDWHTGDAESRTTYDRCKLLCDCGDQSCSEIYHTPMFIG